MTIRFAVAALAVAVLAGCSGALSGSAPLALGPAQAHPSGTWMAPDAKSGALLYISDLNADEVFVYSYPAGKLKGTLTGFTTNHGECSDAAGNVYITDGGADQVLEFAHGGTSPIATFPVTDIYAQNCAVDPKTGRLAVVGDPFGSGPGKIEIFKDGTHPPKEYTTPNVFRMYFAGYDTKGDLFVDGTDMHVTFELAELPARANAAKAMTVGATVNLPGAIQWDGSYLAIGDQYHINGPSKIDQFTVTGKAVELAGTTALNDSCDVLGSVIDGARVVVANDCSSSVMYFNYPQGGQSRKTISGNGLSEPVGLAISRKP